jgi:lysozyme
VNYDKLKTQLRIDEGVRRRRYLDTADPPRWTIGVGHNITDDPRYPYRVTDEPLNEIQIDALLERDIARSVADLDQNANWWRALEEPRQRVLANMCFNMGWGNGEKGLSSFKNTLQAMHFADYAAAAAGMRASLWAKQVGARAERLAKIMETGEG